MKLQVVILLAIISTGCAFFLFDDDDPDWNDLEVTWGPLPTGNHFDSMPRTTDEAIVQGFTKLSDCDASATASHRGAQYTKGGDESLVLLYDVNGYIAGMQTVVPDNLTNNYPSKYLQPPFIRVGNKHYLTAYFTHPSTICTTGRTAAQYTEQGTGTMLQIQNGVNPDTDMMTVPLKQSDLAGTKWVEGECFKTMGKHYWYDISLNMDCDKFFPVFILYNGGKLNAFGWAMGADLPSARLEHPPFSLIGLFMKEPPTCLASQKTLSTMHIFFTKHPILKDWC